MGEHGASKDGEGVKVASAVEPVVILEVKQGEDVFSYVDRIKGRFDQTLYRQVIGAANAFKEGDAAIGVVAADEASRRNAGVLLENTKIKDLYDRPLLADELLELIRRTTDQAGYNHIKDWTMGRLGKFLLIEPESEIKAIMGGLTSETIGCVPKLMTNEELITLSRKYSIPYPEPRSGQKVTWAPVSSPIHRLTTRRTSCGRCLTRFPMPRVISLSGPTPWTARWRVSPGWKKRSVMWSILLISGISFPGVFLPT